MSAVAGVQHEQLLQTRVHLHPRRPGRRADVLSLLGALLHGAQHRQGRRESGARPGQRQQLRGVLQRDGERQVRTPSRPRRPGAHGHRSVPTVTEPESNLWRRFQLTS